MIKFLPPARTLAVCALALGSAPALSADPQTVPPPSLQALVIGGGYSRNSNTAQIEGHLHFVLQLLPPAARRRVLFADGQANNASVVYGDPDPLAEARGALAGLLPRGWSGMPIVFHKPDLGQPIDDAATRDAYHRALLALLPAAGDPPAPTLLYFAGHGSPGGSKEQNTKYDLWNGQDMTVPQLATEIALLPPDTDVTLVMAQCYSGAFGNLLFRGGDPQGELIPQHVAGFFSAKKDRMASGCGWQTSAADYQDFSSYFFGAICGHDRFGNPMQGGDFDGDGHVSLHEAFCYALGHDESIDTPVCTSDVFLRRFAALPDMKIFQTPYREVYQAATPAQRAALDTLSGKLGVVGSQRALDVYERINFRDPDGQLAELTMLREATDRLNTLRKGTLEPLFKKWPGLRWELEKGFREAVDGAARDIAADKNLAHDLLEAKHAFNVAESTIDNERAYLLRFASLYGSIVMAKNLRQHGKDAVKADFERLWNAEQRVLPLVAK